MGAPVGSTLLLFVFASLLSCAKADGARVTGSLNADGYALFKVQHDGTDRIAVLVELRDASDGTYVLLHSASAPRSSGWFELELADFEPCKRYGKDATGGPTLACIVPDGRGELVDVATVGSSMVLFSAPADAGPSPPASVSDDYGVLRHEPRSSSESRSKDSSSTPSRVAYYALMRVEGGGADAPFAMEVRAFDQTLPTQASIARLQ
jgi:hypothetical protein